MKLELDDYTDRAVDPRAAFVPVVVDDQLITNAQLDPVAVLPNDLAKQLSTAQVGSALRLQQQLVFRVGANLGVLSPLVPVVSKALQAVEIASSLEATRLVTEAIQTAIGAASTALSLVPLYGAIAENALGVARRLIAIVEALITPAILRDQLVEAQRYSSAADASLANVRLLPQADTGNWTSLFLPAMRGELAGQVRQDAAGRIVMAWMLRADGVVPRVVIDERPLSRPYEYHFSENAGSPATATGGLGCVPGTSRIVSVIQSTQLEHANIHRGHETLGDPRCGSTRKTQDVDVGGWYPVTAAGAWSLWGFATRPGAAMYTIDARAVERAWSDYCDSIWDGVERLWRNPSWEGGYGCGLWQEMLGGLVRAHCVGIDGVVGGALAWGPSRWEDKLTAADRAAWNANNLTNLVRPAMTELRRAQLEYLEKTPVAAYLPFRPGQAPRELLGAGADSEVATAMLAARARLLGGDPMAKKILKQDVTSGGYRTQLTLRGLGTNTGDGGMGGRGIAPPRWPSGKSTEGYGGGGSGGGGGGGLLVLGALGLGAWALSRLRR